MLNENNTICISGSTNDKQIKEIIILTKKRNTLIKSNLKYHFKPILLTEIFLIIKAIFGTDIKT